MSAWEMVLLYLCRKTAKAQSTGGSNNFALLLPQGALLIHGYMAVSPITNRKSRPKPADMELGVVVPSQL